MSPATLTVTVLVVSARAEMSTVPDWQDPAGKIRTGDGRTADRPVSAVGGARRSAAGDGEGEGR